MKTARGLDEDGKSLAGHGLKVLGIPRLRTRAGWPVSPGLA